MECRFVMLFVRFGYLENEKDGKDGSVLEALVLVWPPPRSRGLSSFPLERFC